MSKKINAVKHILKRRNLLSKDLRCKIKDKSTGGEKYKTCDEKYVSKVINRAIKINEDVEKSWAEILQVPSSLFMEKTRRTRLLSSIEVYALDSYLENQFFLENKEDKVLHQFPEAQTAVRRHDLESDITKLQRKIRKDILDGTSDVETEDEFLNSQSSNLHFYQTVYELHRKKPINDYELKCLFKSFAYLLDGISLESVKEKESSPLVCGLYVVFNKSRELQKLKEEKELERNKILAEELKELFNYTLDEYFEAYE